MNNNAAIRRLAWKELRQITPVLVSQTIVVAILIAMAATKIIEVLPSTPIVGQPGWAWVICSILCSLTGLAVGVSLFSIEDEQGTSNLLRNFPIKSNWLVAGKILPGLLAALLFSSLVLTLLWVFCLNDLKHHFSPAQVRSLLKTSSLAFAVIVLPAIELTAWSILFATIIRRTIPSAICATLAHSLVIQLTSYTGLETGFSFVESYLQGLGNSATFRFPILIAILALDFALAKRWLKQTSGLSVSKVRERTLTSNSIAKPGNPIFKLVWQAIRQSTWSFIVSFVATIAGCILMTNFIMPESPESHAIGVLAVIPVFTMIGWCVFWSDQNKNSFRFFQQHAEHGRAVWASRILVWLPVFAMAFLATATVGYAFSGSPIWLASSGPYLTPYHGSDSLLLLHNIVALFLTCLSGFTIGQFFSMFVRSSILSPILALVVSCLFFGWSLIVFQLYVGFWWTILPINIAFLLATYLHAPNWISGTKTWLSTSKSTALLFATFNCTVVGIFSYRAYEIPELSTPIILPAKIRNLTSKDFPTIWPNKYPEIAEKWDSDPGQPFVYEDQLQQAYESRDKIRRAIKNSTPLSNFQDLAKNDGATVSVAMLDQENLQSFVNANRQSIDELLAIASPADVMPSITTSKLGDMKFGIQDLLLGNAELELRKGNLVESFKSLSQCFGLLESVHFKHWNREVTALTLWDRWMEHPDQDAKTLQWGNIELPIYGGANGDLAIFGLNDYSASQLEDRFKSHPWIPLPSETERYRRLNMWLAMTATRGSRKTQPSRIRDSVGSAAMIF
jgi:hypothetical protein